MSSKLLSHWFHYKNSALNRHHFLHKMLYSSGQTSSGDKFSHHYVCYKSNCQTLPCNRLYNQTHTSIVHILYYQLLYYRNNDHYCSFHVLCSIYYSFLRTNFADRFSAQKSCYKNNVHLNHFFPDKILCNQPHTILVDKVLIHLASGKNNVHLHHSVLDSTLCN